MATFPTLQNVVVEWCRECRDEEPPKQVIAEFILWGKLFPPAALGPRCIEHTAKHIGWQGIGRIDQYAVFDLRNLTRHERDDRGPCLCPDAETVPGDPEWSGEMGSDPSCPYHGTEA